MSGGSRCDKSGEIRPRTMRNARVVANMVAMDGRRIEIPGGYCYVRTRGNNKRAIYLGYVAGGSHRPEIVT
jgi:hypothetical protein